MTLTPDLPAEAERPVRIQCKRAKGWRMPANTIYVGRPSVHGNKHRVGRDGTAQQCVDKFREDWAFGLSHGLGRIVLQQTLDKLRGKNLACWCPIISHGMYQPCHADVLLSIANDVPMEEIIRENIRRAEGEAVR